MLPSSAFTPAPPQSRTSQLESTTTALERKINKMQCFLTWLLLCTAAFTLMSVEIASDLMKAIEKDQPEKIQKSMSSRRLPPSTPPLEPRSSGFWHSRSSSDWGEIVQRTPKKIYKYHTKRKHSKNCGSCPEQVTWKVKFECEFCLSCLSCLSCP